MSNIDFLEKLAVLNELVVQGQTGTPKELAERLCISRSTLYEIIGALKLREIDIKYSRSRGTFYYKNDALLDVRFSIKFLADVGAPGELKNISGSFKIPASFLKVFLTENQNLKTFS